MATTKLILTHDVPKLGHAGEVLPLQQVLEKVQRSHPGDVLEVELEGHRTIHALMDIFWSAITDRADPTDLSSRRPPLSGYVYSLISENYRRVAEGPNNRMPMRYRELQLLTDMVSGITRISRMPRAAATKASATASPDAPPPPPGMIEPKVEALIKAQSFFA